MPRETKSLLDLSTQQKSVKTERENTPEGLEIVVKIASEQLIGQNSIASMSLKNSVKHLELEILYKDFNGEWVKHSTVRGANNLLLNQKVGDEVKDLIGKTGYLA